MKIVEGFRLRHVLGQDIVVGEGTGQVDFNKLITLNESAAYLWKEIEDKEFDEDMLAGLLIDKYGIDSELASKDARAIVSQWCEIGLVK